MQVTEVPLTPVGLVSGASFQEGEALSCGHRIVHPQVTFVCGD